MNQPRVNIKWYVLGDLAASIFTWILFYYLRTFLYDAPFTVPPGFYLGAILYVSGWMSLHLLSGAYEDIYHKTAITETLRTFFISLLGCFGLLFFFILKNPQSNNNNYYQEFFALLIPVFITTLILRLILQRIARSQLDSGKVFFNVLLVGSGKNATQFYEAFTRNNETSGYAIRSFLNTNGNSDLQLPSDINTYQNLSDINNIIDADGIEEVIIAVEKKERDMLTRILQQLSDKDVNIKLTPDAVDIITGAVQTTNVMGVPLIDVHSGQLAPWQKNIKRLVDIVLSVLAMLLLLPLLLYTAIRTRLSSRGSILYAQERIGYKGIPFTIYKFRSMVKDAELNGPMLSSANDPRITKWGKVMRKWRLDELPQLWNIIKGEMSLVGPRPERKFYVDQILLRHPEYKYLFKVKPGLTSWGMVKFGYASSVDEMIQRMTYDLMYVENVSLVLDLRIMILTVLIIMKGEGK
ncbi:MAG TPA: sugar transferase [Ferruginibacter sp.]|nr:sugar transferase [Ferruginibacter sp.]HMP20264.1 sugar transferase [Ferruginibacter sp.]